MAQFFSKIEFSLRLQLIAPQHLLLKPIFEEHGNNNSNNNYSLHISAKVIVSTGFFKTHPQCKSAQMASPEINEIGSRRKSCHLLKQISKAYRKSFEHKENKR